MFRRLAVAGLVGMAIQAPAGRNPVINGTFDFQLVGWKVVDGRADWIRETDEASTVVRLVNVGRLRQDQGPQGATMTGLSQCLSLPPGAYSLSARALVPAGQWKNHGGEIALWFFDNPDCSWLDGKNRPPMIRRVVSDGKWHTSTPLTIGSALANRQL